MSRRRLLPVAVALAVAIAGCSTAPSRQEARNSLVNQLVGGGIPKAVAACVVDAFFEGKPDEELRQFYKRPDLTEAERLEFARLAQQCGMPATEVTGAPPVSAG